MIHTSVIENLAATEAVLNYLAPTSERPRTYAYEPPASEPKTNIRNVGVEVPIRDARPIVGEITLDRHGFELVRHRSAVRDFYDDDEVKRIYYPEAERLLKAATGASRVFVFDHMTRRRAISADGTGDGRRQPVTRVHVDHTARSGPQRVRDLLADEAEELLPGPCADRQRMASNQGAVARWQPLAVCDAASVEPNDLVPSDLVYPHRVGGDLFGYVPAVAPMVLFSQHAD